MSGRGETGSGSDPDHESFIQNQLIERLAESERRHRELLDDLPDVVVSLDPRGRLTYLNAAWRARFGYAPEDTRDRPLREFLHPDDGPKWDRLFEAGFPTDLPEGDLVLRILDADGEVRLVSLRLRRRETGEVVGSLEDVTLQHQLETERLRTQRFESIGRLAAGLAHDFNNLLTAISGNAALARRRLQANGLETVELDNADRGCEQAASLARRMLAFSRGGEPRRRAEDIGSLIREGLDLFLRGSNVRLELDLEPDLPAVDMDRSQIHQVLNNLVVNACQAMPDGGRLRVDVATCTYRPAAGATPCRGVSVSVRDDGCGIPADHLEHVFEPYFTTKEAGNGLGLTSAYWIMQRHEGLLEVESARGVGTLFRFTLPLAESPIAPAASPASPERPRAARILVMDDEPMVRETLVAMLECLGHEVVETAEGAACLSTFTEAAEAGRPFDLVVIDLTIVGGRDGLWTIKHLRELDPVVPTVVASGYSNAPVVADHQRYGFSAVLPKPMTLEQLDALVGRLLESAPTLAG